MESGIERVGFGRWESGNHAGGRNPESRTSVVLLHGSIECFKKWNNNILYDYRILIFNHAFSFLLLAFWKTFLPCTCLYFLLTVGKCSWERSFSSLRKLQSWLRTSMLERYLMLSIHSHAVWGTEEEQKLSPFSTLRGKRWDGGTNRMISFSLWHSLKPLNPQWGMGPNTREAFWISLIVKF